VLAIAGCTKNGSSGDENEDAKPKTNAELFNYAMEQLMAPEIMTNFVDTDLFKDANHFALAVDKLDLKASDAVGLGEIPTLPTGGIEVYRNGDKSFTLKLGAELDDEAIGTVLEVENFEKFCLSMPDATDLYLAGTFKELFELVPLSMTVESSDDSKTATNDMETVKTILGALVDGFKDYKSILFTDENLTKESAEVEIFGEMLTLDKLTLKLGIEDIFAFVVPMFEALPEEMKAELDIEDMTADQMLEMFKEEAGFKKYDFKISFYLDGEEVKSYEIEYEIEMAEELVYNLTSVDIINTADTYKAEARIKDVTDGTGMFATSKTELTVKEGKIKGEISYKPENDLDISLAATDITDMLVLFGYTAKINGDITDAEYDMDIDCDLDFGGMEINLPLTVKGTKADGKLERDIDFSFNFMGMVEAAIGFTVMVEKVSELPEIAYDAENAVTLNDETKLKQLVSEIGTYVSGLDGFNELFGSSSGELGGADSPETAVENYIKSTINVDADGILACVPMKVIEDTAKHGGYGDVDAFIDYFRNEIDSVGDIIKNIDYSYEISDAEMLTGDSLLEIIDEVDAEFGLSATDAATVKVKLTSEYLGASDTQEKVLEVIEIDGSWYLHPFSIDI